ncbi:MAG: 4'-phosphopantetheinyl transferase family protein [Chitinophagaceae bacterium]
MPLFYQQDINENTRLGLWQITEEESFFLEKVPLSREITHPHKRLQHLAGRYLLQFLYPEFPYELIRIADTRKPFLEDEAFHFSISHCGNMAAALVSSKVRVGVDVEEATPKISRILHKFLHPQEMSWLHEQPAFSKEINNDDPASVFLLPTLLWSAKESVFKWYGSGQVDFSEHIRLLPFELTTIGSIPVNFCKPEDSIVFPVRYKIFGNLCLSWVVENYTG